MLRSRRKLVDDRPPTPPSGIGGMAARARGFAAVPRRLGGRARDLAGSLKGFAMEPQKWVELLFTYGPYAAAVLFLSVALYLLKSWRRVRLKDRVQVVVYAGYTLASWVIVIIA